ncbi:pyridoxamine 5'-phosphate oxidase family protein [Streptomyces sp. SID3343]|uniref:pyridoxamine 5'-phosphate oxidase family protein n=1 Tax=Streptomyces sp. SID3343 TaxID=2690260 RepID=UPI001370DFCC|nr:pyridoxamine 5'-phosphate oxidase family protein [Streptomyces sp. SID3343]MYW05067.1 pyridoxamine 5'-phosphate oxidase family protein [Streptomyces sp. SID3343]
MSHPNPGSTPRTRVRRLPEKAAQDRAALHAVLDAGLVAHVAITTEDGRPFVLPVAYARDGERVLIHGSTGSRLFRGLAAGAPTCLTVTLLDGVVVARSAFESSMHYRSAMVLGACTVVPEQDKATALDLITDRLLPGRRDELRPHRPKELAATLVLALTLDETSVKISDSPPDDEDDDLDTPIWAGVVPITEHFGEPVSAPDLRFDIAPPHYLRTWTR